MFDLYRAEDVIAQQELLINLKQHLNKMDEYIIINKTALEQRIQELEQDIKDNDNDEPTDYPEIKKKVLIQDKKELAILRGILEQSTPLIPMIEKSISFCWFESKKPLSHLINIQQDYIKNLKLEI